MERLRTYTAYSVGCWLVWSFIWIAVAAGADSHSRRTILFVFLGWGIGWISATIARAVYPPPRRWSRQPTPGA
jgi:hypothetical protein